MQGWAIGMPWFLPLASAGQTLLRQKNHGNTCTLRKALILFLAYARKNFWQCCNGR